MKKGPNVVQLAIYAISGVAIIVAVLVFSGKLNIGKKAGVDIAGTVTMWGTLPTLAVRPLAESVQGTYKNVTLLYIQKDEKTYQSELLSALASGQGPDLFFLNSDEVHENKDRLLPIQYLTYPELVYKQTFVDQADRFLSPSGILAFPLVIDPLVMYYNRDLLSSAFISVPPKTWDEVITQIPDLTIRDDAARLTQSAIALGAFDNVTHAKDVVSLLLLQSGNPITKKNNEGSIVSALSDGNGEATTRALQFYTRFNTPTDTAYTWNTSLPESRIQFLGGSLAYYLGLGSEFPTLRKQNPNLNMDMTFVPQRAQSTSRLTYGNVTVVGVSKLTTQPVVATTVALWLADTAQVQRLADATGFAPARKDILNNKPRDDAYKALVYQAAIASRGWTDPKSEATDVLFRDALRSLSAGTFPVGQIIQSLNVGLSRLLGINI